MIVPEHIKGDGPDRKLLPNFYRLLNVDDKRQFRLVRSSVKSIIDKAGPRKNDINNSERYKLAQDCPLKTYFPSSYRQILLQLEMGLEAENTDATTEEFNYTCYKDQEARSGIGEFLEEIVPGHYRARIAILPPGNVLDWHIDSNTSYSCRIQIPIFGSCHWQIRRRKDIESRVLNPGEVWFTNTGFPHRVENLGDEDRVVLIIGCKFDAIKDRFTNEIVPWT